MTSFLIDAVLLVALVLTSVRVGRMYQELRRLRRLHDEYRSSLDQTGAMLTCVQETVRELKDQGGDVLNRLGTRVDEARGVLAELRLVARDANSATPRKTGCGADMNRAA